SAGTLSTSVLVAPGVQGPTVTGTHGMGVRTPSAAAVAAATDGLARERHMPNGKMFVIGTESRMLATGRFSTVARIGAWTTRTDGATPWSHAIWAPIVTGSGIGPPSARAVV